MRPVQKCSHSFGRNRLAKMQGQPGGESARPRGDAFIGKRREPENDAPPGHPYKQRRHVAQPAAKRKEKRQRLGAICRVKVRKRGGEQPEGKSGEKQREERRSEKLPRVRLGDPKPAVCAGQQCRGTEELNQPQVLAARRRVQSAPPNLAARFSAHFTSTTLLSVVAKYRG